MTRFPMLTLNPKGLRFWSDKQLPKYFSSLANSIGRGVFAFQLIDPGKRPDHIQTQNYLDLIMRLVGLGIASTPSLWAILWAWASPGVSRSTLTKNWSKPPTQPKSVSSYSIIWNPVVDQVPDKSEEWHNTWVMWEHKFFNTQRYNDGRRDLLAAVLLWWNVYTNGWI